MYITSSVGVLIVLLPLLFIAGLVIIGILLYRHPTKLQKKWYQVPLKKRKRMKQAMCLLGFCVAAGLFISPFADAETWKSEIHLSAKEKNFITKDSIDKINDENSKDTDYIKNEKWLKAFYKLINSDDKMSALLDDNENYKTWKSNITDRQSGEYEIRLKAETVALDRYFTHGSEDDDSDEAFDSYGTENFYEVIRRPDSSFEENYQKLTDAKKRMIRNLKWNYKDGILYAYNPDQKTCINGTAQYFMKDSELINKMEHSGYQGIKKWMEECEKNQAGIKVKVGNKTYLFHNTDQWYKFEKNGLTCLYNYKRLILRFNINKVIGNKTNISDIPQTGRGVWTVMADHTGASSDEVILRSYNEEDVYSKKNVQIYLQDQQIKQMLICWDPTDVIKGFTKEESEFLKACFEKMGISSDDAQKWLDTFKLKKTPQRGKLGSWSYQKGKNEMKISVRSSDDNQGYYVKFYKKSKGNN